MVGMTSVMLSEVGQERAEVEGLWSSVGHTHTRQISKAREDQDQELESTISVWGSRGD